MDVWDYKNSYKDSIQKFISSFNWKKAIINLYIDDKLTFHISASLIFFATLVLVEELNVGTMTHLGLLG